MLEPKAQAQGRRGPFGGDEARAASKLASLDCRDGGEPSECHVYGAKSAEHLYSGSRRTIKSMSRDHDTT